MKQSLHSDIMLNSDLFLTAYNSIEKRLHKITNEGKETSFSMLVERASRINQIVRHFSVDLKEFADLRNAIVHERTDSHVIAEPNDSTVAEIKQIESLLLDPPKVIPKFQVEVYTLSVGDPLSKAVKEMYEQSYSQIPVYNGDNIEGMLTTNTIVRWIGHVVKEEIISIKDTFIEKVLMLAEDNNNFIFLSRGSTLFEVLEKFRTNEEKKGVRLEAILITQNGKPSEALLGIITVWDLPKIYETLDFLIRTTSRKMETIQNRRERRRVV
ncbi:MAG: CBS domain-containing protein [Bacteroidetes bacterium]|nr:CBS domain-containing protein [Bacteroidota bacterium]